MISPPRKFSVSLFSLLLLTLVSGCDSQSSDDSNSAPGALSAEIFKLDTELFSSVGGKSNEAKLNFFGAAIRVWPVSLVLRANMIIPAAVTQAALQAKPTLAGNVWTWSKTIVAEQQNFEFTLTGQPDGSETIWSMKISSDAPYFGETYTNFELFNGRTTTEGISGSWRLFYLQGGSSVNVLNASFNKSDSDTRQLTFSIPSSASEHGGESVMYQVDGLLRVFIWTQPRLGRTHTIRWNDFTSEGSIQSGNHMNGALGCWDRFHDDVGCTS